MPLIDGPAGALHVVDVGPGGPGTPLVMLHGLLLGNVASWYFTAAPTLARSRPVRLYDLRGHGRSARPASGYDPDTMADDLDAVVADLPGPIDLVGHSYGARVALAWAARNPGRVRRIVLVEIPGRTGANAEISAFFEAGPEAMVAALPEGLRAAVANGRRQARRLLTNLAGLATQTTLLADLGSGGDVPDAVVSACTHPVLVVVGASSACADDGRALASRLADARVEVLPGGHYLHLDATAALTETIGAFLDG